VRQGGDTEGGADLGVGHRVLDGRDQIVDEALVALDERRGHAVCAGTDVDGHGLHREPRLLLAHPRVDVEDGHARAIDGDLDLLVGRGTAVEQPQRLGVEIHAEHVVAVGGERMLHGDAAPRAQRRALGPLELRGRLRQLERRLRGGALGVAHGQHRHAAGCAQVALHQGRRKGLHVGHVVEAVADGVGRQERGDVHVEADQMLHRARVLGAVQPLERAPAGIRRCAGQQVHPLLQRRGEPSEIGLRRAPRPSRRHHPGPELPDHLLGGLPRFVRTGQRPALQRQPSGLRPVVVAGRAVLPHQFGLGRGRHCGGVHGCWLQRCGGARCRRGRCPDARCRNAPGRRGRRLFPGGQPEAKPADDKRYRQKLSHVFPDAFGKYRAGAPQGVVNSGTRRTAVHAAARRDRVTGSRSGPAARPSPSPPLPPPAPQPGPRQKA
jgi:hypothetical protein